MIRVFGQDRLKDVAAKYMRDKRMMNIVMKTAPGPDFLSDGEAIQVKELSGDLDQTFKRAIDFAFIYKRLYLVLPVEAINAKSMVKLYLLWDVLKEKYQRSIRVCLVSKNDEKEYSVEMFYDPNEMFNASVTSARRTYEQLAPSNTVEGIPKILAYIDDLPKVSLQEHVKQMGTKITF